MSIARWSLNSPKLTVQTSLFLCCLLAIYIYTRLVWVLMACMIHVLVIYIATRLVWVLMACMIHVLASTCRSADDFEQSVWKGLIELIRCGIVHRAVPFPGHIWCDGYTNFWWGTYNTSHDVGKFKFQRWEGKERLKELQLWFHFHRSWLAHLRSLFTLVYFSICNCQRQNHWPPKLTLIICKTNCNIFMVFDFVTLLQWRKSFVRRLWLPSAFPSW